MPSTNSTEPGTYEQWQKIATALLQIPRSRLYRSEVKSVLIGLGKSQPELSAKLEDLHDSLRQYK